MLGLRNGSLLFSNPNSAITNSRVNPSVRLGEVVRVGGGGEVNWSTHAVPLASPTTSSGYSTMFEAEDGRVGVFWETEGDDDKCRGQGCSIVLSYL